MRYRIKPFPESKQDVKREMYVVLQFRGNIVNGALSVKLIVLILKKYLYFLNFTFGIFQFLEALFS